MNHTDTQFDQATALCRDIFTKKMKDYGSSWRILRPKSVTDQIFIKANRIRSIETKGVSKVDEGIRSELIAIVNYGVIGLIQLELGCADTDDLNYEKGLEFYTKYIQAAKKLMMDKNHDYDEAWRSMRMESFTDLILMKIYRTKQIEDNLGKTLISEGIDANYFDMINYAIFGLIQSGEKS
jgi:Nucleotide modification associated domain 1